MTRPQKLYVPKSCRMDIKQVRERYPEWLLMGNVACNMLQDADDAQIRESVHYCMTHGGVGKPYIFSTSNCIFKGMPVASYQIMLDEWAVLKQEKFFAAFLAFFFVGVLERAVGLRTERDWAEKRSKAAGQASAGALQFGYVSG